MSVQPPLLDYVASLGHATFLRGTYNLNIIGVRTADTTSNEFNDRLCVVYKDSDGWVTRTWSCTTDPGVYWREHPMNLRGTAVLKPGQYRGSHKLGLHRGQYRALIQTGGRVQVWRDSNRDARLDQGAAEEGFFGINIHRASRVTTSTRVDRWSAGCTVFSDPDQYTAFIDLCERSASLYGNRFTYTLVNEHR